MLPTPVTASFSHPFVHHPEPVTSMRKPVLCLQSFAQEIPSSWNAFLLQFVLFVLCYPTLFISSTGKRQYLLEQAWVRVLNSPQKQKVIATSKAISELGTQEP